MSPLWPSVVCSQPRLARQHSLTGKSYVSEVAARRFAIQGHALRSGRQDGRCPKVARRNQDQLQGQPIIVLGQDATFAGLNRTGRSPPHVPHTSCVRDCLGDHGLVPRLIASATDLGRFWNLRVECGRLAGARGFALWLLVGLLLRPRQPALSPRVRAFFGTGDFTSAGYKNATLQDIVV